jgi:hypothetical protein
VKIPVEATEEVSVTVPVVAAIFITLNPFSERTGPLKVVLAIWLPPYKGFALESCKRLLGQSLGLTIPEKVGGG